jgi:hypothetical protein
VSDRLKGFDRGIALDPRYGGRLALEAGRIAGIKAQATPPPAMSAAPMAPARGPQQLVPSFTVSSGGMRRIEGAHWQGLSPLAAAVAQARLRHEGQTERRGTDAPFVPPYNPAQVAVAEDYAALVEWREGSAMRCASLEAGRNTGSAGGGLFIDAYIQQGRWLAQLQARIGTGVAMDIRRHMDRGNARRTITVRAVVDMVLIGDRDLSAVLVAFGWQANGQNRKALRLQLVGALDRMQGYKDEAPQHGA